MWHAVVAQQTHNNKSLIEHLALGKLTHIGGKGKQKGHIPFACYY